jgi:membrane protease YdiL (CAAX protease family)
MLLYYFSLVFTLAWVVWFAATAVDTPSLRTLAIYLGVFMPGIVAIAFTYRERGTAGLLVLLRRLVQYDVQAKWFVFALFFVATIKLLVALILRLLTGAWPEFGSVPLPFMFGAAVLSTLMGGQAGEELGWRGYALPRLAGPVGVGPASLFLGVIWAAWHLPLFFILGADTNGQSFPFYLLQVTALSVAIAWVYVKTGGSLLVTMLLHAAVNNTKDIVPSAVPGASNPWALSASPVGWLTLGLLWVCAVWFLYDMRENRGMADLVEA